MLDFAQPLPLDRHLLRQCELTPHALALVDADRRVSFAELGDMVQRAAAALQTQGVAAGEIVGLHMERSAEWVAALFAILHVGAVAMPLPTNYPPARLREILSKAGTARVVDRAASPLHADVPAQRVRFETLVGTATVAAVLSSDAPDRAAFVLCSSGSTGSPKLIVRSHRSFIHRLRWTWDRHPFRPQEIGCHKAHTTTTHGLYELMEPLLCGAPAVVMADEDVRDLDQFWALVRTRGITRLLIVPSAMQASLELPGFEPPPLRVLVLMGEPLAPGLARRLVDTFDTATALYSIYGSTEASSTLLCNLREIGPAAGALPLGVPIGTSVSAHVLDGALEPVAAGKPGRLYIGGEALFDGYLAEPELTARVVLRHPATGERLYDTRDDVKRSAAGEIVFSGRADDTVKVRGFRVELGEIESAMLDCAGMTQAAVVVTDDREPSLVGFYTPAAVPARAVLEVLRDRLPPYMVPTRLIGLGSFPLTERSKLDRRRLLAEHLQERGDAGIENASAIEQRVADVWARALGHRGFELDSSFFEVGGTSLKTAVLAHRLREAFGLDAGRLRESFVYRFPTVTAMARALAHDGHEPGAHSDESGVLVTLRRATDPTAPPVFCVASAGGTLGAYQKFAGAIRYAGEVVGLRDPYVSAGRDPTESFDRWVDRYLAAVRERQAQGPYCLVAYSSAGAFGIEIAQRLRDDGHHVRLLALVDPLGIDGDHWRRYGWWVMLATHARPAIRWLTRLAGAMRQPAAAMIRAAARRGPRSTFALDDAQFQALAQEMLTSRPRIEALAALMELNTGLPIDLTHRGTSIGPVAEPAVPASAGASDAAPTAAMTALKARVAAVMPEVDPDTIERIAKQYKLQLDAQRAYRMRPYDGAVLLVEPASTYSGLLRWQFRPHVRSLRTVTLDLDAADEGTAALTRRFGPWAPHFRCMRDGKFAESLAREVERALAPVAMP